MNWSEIQLRWGDVVGHLRRHWPEMDRQSLMDIAGDRTRLVEYLAARHDLTFLEAEDAIEDWIALLATRLAV